MVLAQLLGFALMAAAGCVACFLVLVYRAIRQTWRVRGILEIVGDLMLVAAVTAIFVIALFKATWVSLRVYALLGFIAGAWTYQAVLGRITSRVLLKGFDCIKHLLSRLRLQ